MKKRTVIRLGDIFGVKCDDRYRYFQYVADDMTMLNSRVIRVFKEKYPLDEVSELTGVAQGEIDFYAHTSIKLGIKMDLWKKVGNAPIFGEIDVIFRDSKDYGESKVAISERWYVWRINEEFRYVGKLEGENRKAEIGTVKAPTDVVNRIRTGRYHYFYPNYKP